MSFVVSPSTVRELINNHGEYSIHDAAFDNEDPKWEKQVLFLPCGTKEKNPQSIENHNKLYGHGHCYATPKDIEASIKNTINSQHKHFCFSCHGEKKRALGFNNRIVAYVGHNGHQALNINTGEVFTVPKEKPSFKDWLNGF